MVSISLWIQPTSSTNIDMDKESYYYIKYSKQQMENEYEKRLEKISSSFLRKKIKEEHRKAWREFCEANSQQYEAYSSVKSVKCIQTTCLICI